MIGRWRPRQPNPRQLLLQDLVRVTGYLDAILTSARRLQAPDTADPATALMLLYGWMSKLGDWSR